MDQNSPLSTSLLRQLRKEVNTSIDEYIALVEQSKDINEQHDAEVELKRCQARISECSQALALESQEPFLKAASLGWLSTINVALRMAVDLKLFEIIDGPTTIDQLQLRTGADKVLLQRVMRLLAAERWVTEIGPNSFHPNRFTVFANQTAVLDWIRINFDMTDAILAKAPTYFASRSHQAPSNSGPDPPVKLALGTNTVFEWLDANPTQMGRFASSMRIQQHQSSAYMPKFPFTTELESSKPLSSDEVAIVDVGGGLGQWLDQTLRENPNLTTNNQRMILQDLPSVIDNSACTQNPQIEKHKHDFFTPQPVKGARYYHMRGILHDWPDDDCIRILENLAPAFHKAQAPDVKSDFSSKLLITGFVIPAERCNSRMAMLDIGMMILNGMERTEEHYRSLLENTGFKLLRVWRPDIGYFCVIEAELA